MHGLLYILALRWYTGLHDIGSWEVNILPRPVLAVPKTATNGRLPRFRITYAAAESYRWNIDMPTCACCPRCDYNLHVHLHVVDQLKASAVYTAADKMRPSRR